MARELLSADKLTILTRDEMSTVEVMLGMTQGYVLDFSDRTFNDFIKRNWNIDATAPTYKELGTSKANRLRGLLRALKDHARADVLQKFLEYRNHPSRASSFEEVSPDLEAAYLAIISRLNGLNPTIDSANWTGRPSLQRRVVEIRAMAPYVLHGLEQLIGLVEDQRFNDPETADALDSLRRLHQAMGDLIEAIDQQRPITEIVSTIEAYGAKFGIALKGGAKVFAVAPAMTLGISHMLAWMINATPDTGLVATVYAAIVGADALKSFTAQPKDRP